MFKLFQVSRRDYPSVLGRDNLNGGTTVSGTLLAAAKIEEHLVRKVLLQLFCHEANTYKLTMTRCLYKMPLFDTLIIPSDKKNRT